MSKSIFDHKTYEIVQGPPGLSRHEYRGIVFEEFSTLLDTKPDDENLFHQFFETHPCMIPSPYTIFGRGGHGPWPGALISHPVLPSFTQKVPDFMWIVHDSGAAYAVLIEIEAPAKPWSTAKGKQSEKLTQAIDQIKEWKAWFSEPLNVEQFKHYYRIPSRILQFRSFLQRYILIYGRREDALANETFAMKRNHLQGQDETYMTYDRLVPQTDLMNCLCVNVKADGYKAIRVPPTVRLGPIEALDWSIVSDKEAALRQSDYMSPERKQFLIDRWRYWDNWAKSGNLGCINAGDSE